MGDRDAAKRIPMTHAESVIHSDLDIMGGTPVFVGTRVPFQTLLDYLEGGQPLAEFLTMSRQSPGTSTVLDIPSRSVPQRWRLPSALLGNGGCR
jgi:hypothetical protein